MISGCYEFWLLCLVIGCCVVIVLCLFPLVRFSGWICWLCLGVCYLVLICGQAAGLVVCGCFYLRLLLVWLGDWHCSFASCFVYRFLFRGWFVSGDWLLVWAVLISMLCLVVCML